MGWASVTRSGSKNAGGMHEVFKALGEPQRIAILRLVHRGELPAGEIASHFKTTRQAISQHLRLLTDAGLLEQRREGTKRLYRVREAAFGDLRTYLDTFWGQGLAALKRRVEGEKGKRRDDG